MFDPVLNGLPAFASFFAAAIVMLAIFLWLYMLITPYDELALIRDGNVAAAVSLGGTVIGFAVPLALSVAVSHNLYALIGWGAVAGVVQLLVYAATRVAVPRINECIPQGKVASGIFLASLSIGVGILNAGCIA